MARGSRADGALANPVRSGRKQPQRVHAPGRSGSHLSRHLTRLPGIAGLWHQAAMIEARPDDEAEVIALWKACGLTRPWNDPAADFARAVAGPASAVLLLREENVLAAGVMVGCD